MAKSKKTLTVHKRTGKHSIEARKTIPFDGRSKVTPEQKLSVVKDFFFSGNLQEAAKKNGVTTNQAKHWRETTDWWHDAFAQVKIEQQDRLDSQLTSLLTQSIAQMQDRLEHGDEKVDKDGKKYRQKISFRDLALAGLSVAYDKRALNRGEATSRVERVDTGAHLQKLADEFTKIARKTKVVRESSLIEGTLVKDKE